MPKESIVFSGKMFQIKQWEGRPGVIFEAAERAGGVRVLAEVTERGITKVLLTKEKRREASGYDYRLPGGKIFDSIEDLSLFDGSMEEEALKKARSEAKEEAGVESAMSWELLEISKAGASVDWDLYYFLAKDAVIGERALEEGEKGDFEECVLVSKEELFMFLKEGKIQEGRSAAVLFKWLANNNYLEVK